MIDVGIICITVLFLVVMIALLFFTYKALTAWVLEEDEKVFVMLVAAFGVALLLAGAIDTISKHKETNVEAKK